MTGERNLREKADKLTPVIVAGTLGAGAVAAIGVLLFFGA